jgi:hypothetical protein
MEYQSDYLEEPYNSFNNNKNDKNNNMNELSNNYMG